MATSRILLALVFEVVLPKHSQPGVPGNAGMAFRRVEAAVEDVQERRLSGPVRTHQTVPFPPIELERYAGEEGPVTEGLAEVRDGNHGGESKGKEVFSVAATAASHLPSRKAAKGDIVQVLRAEQGETSLEFRSGQANLQTIPFSSLPPGFPVGFIISPHNTRRYS